MANCVVIRAKIGKLKEQSGHKPVPGLLKSLVGDIFEEICRELDIIGTSLSAKQPVLERQNSSNGGVKKRKK